MKLLTFSTLFPNSIQPGHGPFVEVRLSKLVESGRVESRVVAPVPWFPRSPSFTVGRFERYSRLTRVPFFEERIGLGVYHPRYPVIPKIGMSFVPLSMALAARRTIERIIADGFRFDAIDAHYFYPDGVAAILLGRWFARPVVVTARGSDVNLLPEYALPRRMIIWAAKKAAALITVSGALERKLVELGIDSRKITMLRNGVDLEKFRTVPRDGARAGFGRLWGSALLANDPPLIASVGNLVPLKGHDLVIEAVAQLPGVALVIAGSGPERETLEVLAKRLGVADRVSLVGQVAQSDLPLIYNAADALVLASSHEGWPNVLLEAMACGTPTLATDVGGAREIVAAPEAGSLIAERTRTAIADKIRALLAAPPSRESTRRYAERFSWDETTQGQIELFSRVIGKDC